MINDGHFHLHYPAPDLVPGSSDLDLDRDVQRVRKLRKRYKIDKIVGIFIPCNINAVNEILNKNPYIYAGIYTTPLDNLKELKKKANFNFVKIGADDSSPYSKSLELLEDGFANGFKKFQVHGSYFTRNFLNLIKSYIKDYDVKIYLAHGIDALYSCFSEVKPEEIKQFEGNLLLGTSPSIPAFEIPNDKIKKGLKDGLESFITFESDFGLHYPDWFYSASVESVIKSIGENEKILYENVKLFLE